MTELAGTGRHLSPLELRVWTSFLDASRIIETELAAQLAEHHAMSHRDYEVLVRLDGAGGSMRLVTLARQIEASSALISQTIDRLEKRGWVERRRAESDGRGVEAVLTTHGQNALSDAAEPHAALVRQLLLDPIADALDPIADALGTVADHLRAHRRNDTCDNPACPLNPT